MFRPSDDYCQVLLLGTSLPEGWGGGGLGLGSGGLGSWDRGLEVELRALALGARVQGYRFQARLWTSTTLKTEVESITRRGVLEGRIDQPGAR